MAVADSPKGVALYDIAADSVVEFAETPSARGLRPQFRTPGLVSFTGQREPADAGYTWGQDSLFELDPATGQATELLRLPNIILGYDWTRDGTILAYQLRVEGATEILPVALCLFDTRSGSTSLLRALEVPDVTDPGQRGETAVAWSPDGRAILVTDTAEQPSLRIVGVEGRDLVPGEFGTFGRWLADDAVLYARDPQDSTKPWPWFTISPTTGARDAFGLPAEAYRPALSPGHDLIAFDDGDGTQPSIYVLDIDQGTSRRLARGYVAPVWLGPALIAATAAGPCPPDNFCPIPWSPLGTTIAIDLATGRQRQLTLPTTLQSELSYGMIDVSMADAGS